MLLTTWRKSSFGSEPDGICVELAFDVTGVALRDSKNVAGPALTVGSRGWQALVARAGRAW